ncbi:MAG TPA: nucleotidyltransferase domain-containing protein, partial [Gemmatimonadaceae bacterium]|nr:nucleotidyltransferase domain-containing protein [Gemmatimonadaceae bacterium]
MSFLPPKLQRAIVAGTKHALVATNRSTPLRFFGKRAYDAMELVIRQRFGSVEGVRAVYLCHSLAAGECYPGLSDFDLAVVFDDPDPPRFYDRIRRRWGSLKRYFPISDLSILTVGEFDQWQKIGGGWDPLDEVRNWKLIAGEDLRHARFDATAEEAALDRMQWAVGHFQNLLSVAIKEEQKSPLMAVIARRQLHKCFWNAVLALDAKYLAVPAHRDRVSMWLRDHGAHRVVESLQAMYRRRFL